MNPVASCPNSKRDGVGAGLVPARAGVVQALDTGRAEPGGVLPQFKTGRDKPVPYGSVVRSSMS